MYENNKNEFTKVCNIIFILFHFKCIYIINSNLEVIKDL